jgi:hypothetical protein
LHGPPVQADSKRKGRKKTRRKTFVGTKWCCFYEKKGKVERRKRKEERGKRWQ